MLQRFIKYVKKYTDSEISQDSLDNFQLLLDNFHWTFLGSRFKLIARQIDLGLTDHYYRIKALHDEGHTKSSSLRACILRYGEEEGTRFCNETRKKTSGALENFIKKYGEVEGPIKFKESNKKKSNSLENYIRRFGEVDGPIKYKEYWANTNFTTKKSTFIKRFGEVEGLKRYKDTCNRIGYLNTLEGFIEKYGEDEGKRLFVDRNSRKSISQSKETMVKRMIKEKRSMNEILWEIDKRWSRSEKTFIIKFGEKEGKEKYKQWLNSNKKNNPLCMEYYKERNIDDKTAYEMIVEHQLHRNKNVNFYSKESMTNLLTYIFMIESHTGVSCFYGENELAITLSYEENKICDKMMFFYDFTFPELNLIIEYHGELFHEDIDYNQTLIANTLSDIIHSKDLIKKYIAESRGYEVLVVRSWKLHEDIRKLVERCKEKGYILG